MYCRRRKDHFDAHPPGMPEILFFIPFFITKNDVLEAGLPLCHINRFGDDAHIIYLNSQIQDETNLDL